MMLSLKILCDLEYFDADVFPEQFALAIKDLGLDQVSDNELEDTLHILKVTELIENEVMSLEEMKDNLINELVKTESIALMMMITILLMK